jgi:hypothetical protein
VSTAFPSYRALFIRAEGESARDGQWLQVVGGIMGDGNGFGNLDNLSADAAPPPVPLPAAAWLLLSGLGGLGILGRRRKA